MWKCIIQKLENYILYNSEKNEYIQHTELSLYFNIFISKRKVLTRKNLRFIAIIVLFQN